MPNHNNKLFSIEPADRRQAVESLVQVASPRRTFFMMVVLSTALATLGLLIGNVAVVIGAMLVAPLLSPVLCVGMGVVIVDFKLIRFSLISLVKSVGFALLVAVLVSFIVGTQGKVSDLIYQIEPHYIFIYIALLSGLAAAFAWGHPGLQAAMSGVAVSVALIPPLAAIGIGVSILEWGIIRNSLQLFLINLVCIVLISIVAFHLMGFYKERKSAAKVVKEEEKILKKE